MIALLLITQALAQADNSSFLKALDNRFQEPPRFGKEPAVKTPRIVMPPPAPTMGDILASPVVQKALVKGGNIQEIESGKVQAVTSRMLVDVHNLADERGFFYIVDNNGEVHKRVHLKHAQGIQDDIEMYEPPRHYLQVFERKNVSPYDHHLKWIPEVILAVGRGSAGWTSDVLADSKANNASGYRLGGHWMADLSGKYQIGLALQYESMKHTLTSGEARYKNISFGIAGKSMPIEWGGFPWRIISELRYGPTGSLTVETTQYRYDLDARTTSLLVGWEVPNKNAAGEWSWGLSWQRDWPKLRNQKVYVAQDSSSSTNDMISVHLSQGFDW